MDIRQLRYLAALAREKHFTKAALACGITQPTLSNRIRQLEEELGVPVVSRGQRFFGLTAEGERVLKWAQDILNACDSMTQELGLMTSGLAGRLTLGVIPSAGQVTPHITGALCRRHPEVDFKLVTLSSIEILEGLRQHRIDVGVTYLDNEPLDQETRLTLYNERYSLAMRRSHPLAERASVTWSEAAATPLCLLTSEMQNRRIVDRAFREAGAKPRCHVETTSFLSVLAHVRIKGLVGIVPDNFIEALGGGGGGGQGDIVARPLKEPEVQHQVGLVAVDRDVTSPLVAGLFDVCRGLDLSDPGAILPLHREIQYAHSS